MKLFLATAMAVMISGAVFAQETTTTTTKTVVVTPEQESAITSYVTKEKRTIVVAPAGFVASNGVVVPQTIEIHSFPSEVGVTNYSYSTIGGQTVLIDPQTRQIVRILP
jgi:hypothetical protein